MGVFGGYPGANVEFSTYRDGNTEDSSYPSTEESMPGPEHTRWGVNTLYDDGVLHVRHPESGGYGNPVKRDPDRVVEEVAEGKITPETARTVYCIPVNEDGVTNGSVEAARE